MDELYEACKTGDLEKIKYLVQGCDNLAIRWASFMS